MKLFGLPSEIWAVMISDLKLKPEDFLKMSIYQILMLYILWLDSELRKREKLEELKLFMNPEVYMRMREERMMKRKNIEFENIIGNRFGVDTDLLEKVFRDGR